MLHFLPASLEFLVCPVENDANNGIVFSDSGLNLHGMQDTHVFIRKLQFSMNRVKKKKPNMREGINLFAVIQFVL